MFVYVKWRSFVLSKTDIHESLPLLQLFIRFKVSISCFFKLLYVVIVNGGDREKGKQHYLVDCRISFSTGPSIIIIIIITLTRETIKNNNGNDNINNNNSNINDNDKRKIEENFC